MPIIPLHLAALAIFAMDTVSVLFRAAFPVMIAKWWKYIPLLAVAIVSVPFSPIPGIPVAIFGILKRDIREYERKRL